MRDSLPATLPFLGRRSQTF